MLDNEELLPEEDDRELEEFLEIERIPEETNGRIFGPWRVKPGGLSVRKNKNFCL